MALVTNALIQALMVGFKKLFQDAQEATPSHWDKVATRVPSTTKSNTYGWLGQFPEMREWIGDRVLKSIKEFGYSIINKDWESTVDVKRTDIEDDEVGVYTPLFQEAGRAAKVKPDQLVFKALKDGRATLCYDGQNFFDTDHPVYANSDGTGAVTNVANMDVDLVARPNNRIWYLLCTNRAIKPIIFQDRKAPVFTAMTALTDEVVFTSNKFRFGVDSRCNVGYGFWQMAFASNQPLTKENFAAAKAALESFTADGGNPLGIEATLLVVPPTLEGAGRELLVKDANGGNEWAGSAELLKTAWIA